MKNSIQDGDILELAAPYAVLAGQGALIGTVFGVASVDLAISVRGNFSVEGVFLLAKVGAQAWTEGAAIYWDNAAKNCTTTSAGNTKIGVATLAAQAADTTGYVRLNGAF